jgi:hypothetical protein
MADDKNKVPLFDGSNFSNWKFRMETLLDELDLLDILETPMNASVEAVDASDITAQDKVKKKEQLKKRDKKCKSQIVQRVADSHLEYVKDKETAFEIWTELTNTFERQGLAGQLLLRKELLLMKYSPAKETLEAHFLKFDRVMRDLRSTGAKMEEQDIVCHLLLTMPGEYDSVVTALETLSSEKLTMSFVRTRLRDEDMKREGKQRKSKNETQPPLAFATPEGTKQKWKNERRCHNCGKYGHYRSECRLNKSRSEHQQKQFKSRNANVATNSASDEGESEFSNEHSFSAYLSGNVKSTVWCLDSGASEHLVKNGNHVSNIQKLDHPVCIKIAKSGVTLKAETFGEFRGKSVVGNKVYNIYISKVLIVPGLEINLLSVRKLEMQGLAVVFKQGCGRILKGDKIIGVAQCKNKLYELKLQENVEVANLSKTDGSGKLWHHRLGHIGNSKLQKLSQIVDGVTISAKNAETSPCDVCVGGKQTKLQHKEKRPRTNRPLELVHSDLLGPVTPESHDKKKYILTFIDDFTHFTVAYPISSKTEIPRFFRKYEAMATAHFNLKISRFRSDNGREYMMNALMEHFEKQGIQMECTVPYTPEQNGVAERLNRTIVEKARCMLLSSNLPKSFWTEAVTTAAFLINRSPTVALENCTPAEKWFGFKPNLKKVRIFGCLVYQHIPKQLNPRKFDTRTRKCILLGYAPNGYRLWLLEERKVVVGHDVIFDEATFPSPYGNANTADREEDTEEEDAEEEDTEEKKLENEEPDEDEEENWNDATETPGAKTQKFTPTQTSLPRRSSRTKRKPEYFDEYTVIALNAEAYVDEAPLDYEDIKNLEDRKKWYQAVLEELRALDINETWTYTKLPPGKTAINNKWVFRLKKDANGEPQRYKARLVIKGCSQKRGIDYDEVYAPVARLTTIRTLLSVIHENNLHAMQMDVKNAFLHGKLKETIYMKVPDGINGKDGLVCKLNRSLYGLKQAPRVWNERFDTFVKGIHFKQSPHDRCLYIKIQNGTKIYLLLYVDDIILAGDDKTTLDQVTAALKREFSMSDLGELRNFLGISITRNDNEMGLSQFGYIKKLLTRFGMQDCKGAKTPMDAKIQPEQVEPADCIVDTKPYRELIGCLMYLMLCTRPDLSAALNFYSRFQANATDKQWVEAKRMLRYLKDTQHFGLIYRRQTAPVLAAYADSDWAGSLDRKSTTGFLLQVHGNVVCWSTKKQNTVALSSTEAEYVALACAAAELVWLRNLLRDMHVTYEDSTIMFEDNQSCIHLLSKYEHRRMKHLDVKYHFVRDLAMSKIIDVKYIPSNEQRADILTKGLPRTSFEKLRLLIGVKETQT